MMFEERRHCVRHKVNGPVFASFDGVTGGMILDLSEQGLSMQTAAALDPDRRELPVHLLFDLPDSNAHLETTGYIAWADALGRAGVRFSDLPAEARQRLDEWLAVNDEAPSRKAPKLKLERSSLVTRTTMPTEAAKRQSVSLEAGTAPEKSVNAAPVSNTMQYEFHSLGSDLNSALRVIGERARTLLRGTGAAIAIAEHGPMMCRASIGTGGPPLGTRVDINSGFTGECVREGRALRCDDAETDGRVAQEICRRLGIRSIAAAPLRYERDVVGLLEVFSPHTFAFDEGDLAILERLAQTALLMVSEAQLLKRT
ncbi:MAG TPA: GAF domain-containing protein [Candidatus Sulfotelmatobacter sp.]|nr:GAF domain-containing protein [Candidatus Sulfotelmatobacter sp.]